MYDPRNKKIHPKSLGCFHPREVLFYLYMEFFFIKLVAEPITFLICLWDSAQAKPRSHLIQFFQTLKRAFQHQIGSACLKYSSDFRQGLPLLISRRKIEKTT